MDNGQKAKDTVRVNKFSLMAVYTKEIEKKINLQGLVNMSLMEKLYMKGILKQERCMDKAH